MCHRVKRVIMYQCMELIKVLDHISMYGTDLSGDEITENMYRMFVNLLAEVITQRMSMIHAEFSKFFRTEFFNGESNKKGGPLAILRGIQQCFIEIQNRYVRATDELSRLVIETAGQRPATLKDFRTAMGIKHIRTYWHTPGGNR